MADEAAPEVDEVAAPEPVEEVQMSVLDALKEVRLGISRSRYRNQLDVRLFDRY
jgi:hypothetical protein